MRCWLPGLLMLTIPAGCASQQGPEVLRLDSSEYARAFDAALDAARHADLAPAFRDRRAGVIWTEPTLAGSVLEPWRRGSGSLENTMAFQRWRARFEFTPVAPPPPTPPPPETTQTPQGPEASSASPDLLGLHGAAPDLAVWQGLLELRVEVVIERADSPGVRRGTWSRANTTRARITRPATDPDAPTTEFWTPIARDPDFERRLLADVRRRLVEAQPAG